MVIVRVENVSAADARRLWKKNCHCRYLAAGTGTGRAIRGALSPAVVSRLYRNCKVYSSGVYSLGDSRRQSRAQISL
jgi:hypothetical protein